MPIIIRSVYVFNLFMKKSLVGPLVTGIVLVLVAALFVFVFITLNRMDKKIITVQQGIVDNSSKLTSVVNFLNSASNAQATK